MYIGLVLISILAGFSESDYIMQVGVCEKKTRCEILQPETFEFKAGGTNPSPPCFLFLIERWMASIIHQAFRKKIAADDVYDVLPSEKSERVTADLVRLVIHCFRYGIMYRVVLGPQYLTFPPHHCPL